MDELYVAARCALLDALKALGPHRSAAIVVGAQAIYIRAGEADLTVAPYTTDGDIALEPLGHMAGLAASIVTAIATIGAAVLSVPIGLAFNGTTVPLAIGVMCLVGLAYLILRQLGDEDEVTAQP